MSGKLEVDIGIISLCNGTYKIRLSIGGYMFFDSPETVKKNADIILQNILRRLEK